MKKEKVSNTKKVFKLIIFIIAIIGFVFTFVFYGKIFGENSIFQDLGIANEALNAACQKIPAIIKSFQIIVIATICNMLIKLILKKVISKSKRSVTISTLVGSFTKYLIAIIALLAVLGAWGVDTGALLASAGILGLVVGLGAQSLIADIIAGIFIVFEGEYQVGDIIVIDGWRGTVSEIGIRTTKIVDAGGNIKIINNSEIKSIINQTQDLSLATCEVGIEYGESIEKVETIIQANLAIMKENIPSIVEGPYYKGVKALNSSSVDLLFIAKCKEENLYQTQRDMNREIKIIFDKNNINIPFPQIVLNKAQEYNNIASVKEQKIAENFVNEQKILSKDLEEKVE